jgi:hypothetical protein
MKMVAVSATILIAALSFGQGQGQGRGQGRWGRGGMNNSVSLTRLLQRSDVQADLALTDDEKIKIQALRPARGNRGGGGGAGGAGGGGAQRTIPTAEEMAARQAEERKTVADILTPDQLKRLDEIRIQISGDRAVLIPEVQTALALTEDQKTKIRDLNSKYRDATQSLMEKMRSGEISREDFGPKVTANTNVLGEELRKLLTAAQADKLKSLGGKPFKADPEPSNG